MRARPNGTVRVLAMGLLLALPLFGCSGGGVGVSDRPGGGGGNAAADTTSLERLLDRADRLIASDTHCLHDAAVVGCGSGNGGAVGGGEGDGAPGSDDTVSAPNDGTAGGTGFERIVISFDCTGKTCTAKSLHEGRISIRDIRSLVGSADNGPIGTIGGVELVAFAASDADGETTVWGGWMDHAFFAVKGDGGRSGGRQGPLSELAVQAVAAGADAATRPTAASGSATWTGAMVGRSVDPALGPVWASVRRDAAVTVDFDANEVDVRFTNIVDASNEAWSVPRIGWDGLSLLPGGVFEDAAGTIEGRFFGSGHGEAAGVFHKRDLVGAFGATRTVRQAIPLRN